VSSAGPDPLELALHHALRVFDAARIHMRRAGGDRVGEAFRRRAKDFPSLMAEAGLAPALTFYLSKSNPSKLPAALRLASCRGLDTQQLDAIAKGLGEELGRGEGEGYTLMAALVLDALDKLAGLGLVERGDDGCPGEGDGYQILKRVAERLLEIRSGEGGEEVRAAALIEPYLVELKKLADAFFGERGGE
jgi:CRISPR type III-B/RAMP module-associated protein Cmr5